MPAPAAQGPPPSPTALSSASDSTTSTTTTTSSATTTTPLSSTPPPKPRGKPPKRAPKPVPTASNPAAAKAHAPMKPAPAARPKLKTAAKQPPGPVGAPRPQPAAKLKPKPKPGTTTAARARPPEDVLYDIPPQPSQARRQQRPARRPPTVTDAAASTFMAERAAAEARHISSRHRSKPAPQANGPPPTGPQRRQGPPAASPSPYQPSMSAHIQQMPRYRRHRESQPNPEAETVRAYPGVHIRPRPHSPRTPTAQDYEESPRPATATSPHDHITPTHAHSSAQGHGPAQGQWWRRWTHTQLLELQKWPWAEPSLEGLVHRPRRGSAENRRLQPAGGWMPQAAWEAMLADALHPPGVHPRNLPAPQDHPYVPRRLRETLQETQQDGIRLWDIIQSPIPHTHTPSPPHKRRRTDTGGTNSTPGALRATQQDAPDPPASGAAA